MIKVETERKVIISGEDVEALRQMAAHVDSGTIRYVGANVCPPSPSVQLARTILEMTAE